MRAATPGPRQLCALKALQHVGVGDLHQLHRAQRGGSMPEHQLIAVLDNLVARGWAQRQAGTLERWALTPNGKDQLDAATL